MRTWPFIMLLAWVLASCKRDIAPRVVKCAGDIVRSDLDKCDIIEYEFKSPRYESPTANPNNPDEFAFVENGKLVKYNISTKEKRTLVSNLSAMLTPDWGKSGWIVFSASWKIWKIHENGSELQQITFGPREIWPEFDPTGTKIIYPRNMEYGSLELRQNPGLWEDYKIMVIDLNGNAIDSFCRYFDGNLCNPWEYSSWSEKDLIAAEYRPNSDERGIAIYDLDGNIVKVPYSFEEPKRKEEPFISDIEWHPTKNRVYFRDTRGIRWVEPDTEKLRFLRKNCDIEYYEDFTFTGDGKHIIAVKGETIPDRKTCTFTTEYYFVRMESDGSKEEIIDMP